MRLDALGPRSHGYAHRAAGGKPGGDNQTGSSWRPAVAPGSESGKPAPAAETPYAVYHEDNSPARQHQEHATKGVASADADARLAAPGPRPHDRRHPRSGPGPPSTRAIPSHAPEPSLASASDPPKEGSPGHHAGPGEDWANASPDRGRTSEEHSRHSDLWHLAPPAQGRRMTS